MPFDAGFTAAVTNETVKIIKGSKIEKVQMPERDEIILSMKNGKESFRLLIGAKANSPRFCLTTLERENPPSPPMFCMLLRKHISGGILSDIRQLGFERAVEFEIDTYNELGFPTKKYLILETTGRYSNIIFCDAEKKIVSALRLSELASDEKRKLIAGFSYIPLPLPEGRENPLEENKEGFIAKLKAYAESTSGQYPCEKYLLSKYYGMSPLICREIVYRTTKNAGSLLSEMIENGLCDNLYLNFDAIYSAVRNGSFSPYLIKNKNGEAMDFSFSLITQYENSAVIYEKKSFGELLDTYYGERDRAERIRAKSQDILKLLSNASSRINKKAENQRSELAECAEKEKYKKFGDLITSNIYMLKKGMTEVEVTDYSDENMPKVRIKLEINLSPSQNAQKYYKKYNKMKSAEAYLSEQIKNCENELSYIDTIFESLTKAQNEKDLEEIRDELRIGGYGKKLEALSRSNTNAKKAVRQKMKNTYSVMTFRTSGGYDVLCGKNNLQNDYITTVVSDKFDYWFHVKGMPGSHTVMRCGRDEPDARDFTECAMIAAYYSSGRKIPNVAVDYTRIKNIKKPSGAKPGLVIYDTNYSAYVTADEQTVLSLRV